MDPTEVLNLEDIGGTFSRTISVQYGEKAKNSLVPDLRY